MTPEERSSIENGIWLCRSCARLIDSDERVYSIELLRMWKDAAEYEQSCIINQTDNWLKTKSSIYVVDNYIGLRTLVHLKNSPAGVDIILFSDNVGNNKLHNIEYTDFRKE